MMHAMARTTGLATLALTCAVAALAACGSGTTGSASESAGGATAAASATLPTGTPRAAACGALTPDQAKAVTGATVTPSSPTNGLQANDAYALDTCVWGDLTKGGALALQVFTPGAVADPLSLMTGASAATAVPNLPQGKLYRIGLLPGGGGVGITVTWQEGQSQVALSLLKTSPTAADEQALIAAAGQAEKVL